MSEVAVTVEIDGYEYAWTVPCAEDATSVRKVSVGLQNLLDGTLTGHFKKLRDGELH